jgi:hypothetical protein
VCLCYVENATSAQIRYAMRRLRRKAPDAYILVTMLGASIDTDVREALQGFPNSGLVQSLDETVAQVRAAATGQQNPIAAPDAKPLARAANL